MNRRRFLKCATTGLFVPAAFGQTVVVPNRRRNFQATPAAPAGLSILNAWKGRDSVGVNSSVATVAPTAGNLLFVCVSSYHGSTTSVVDNINSGGSGWTKIDEQAASSTSVIAMWYRANIQGGVTSVTASGGTGNFVTLVVHEVQGASISAPFTSGEYTKNLGNSTTPTTLTKTSATASTICFAAAINDQNGTFTINASGTTGTWNLFDATNSQETNGALYNTISVPNIVLSSATAEVHKWTTPASFWAAMEAYVHA